jgi:hypothetical protein
LKDGVIVDFDAQKMISMFIKKHPCFEKNVYPAKDGGLYSWNYQLK